MAMTEQNFNKYIMRFSLAAAAIALIFSALNGYDYPAVFLRTILAFAFITVLGRGLGALWKNFSPPPVHEDNRTANIDIVLDESNEPESDRDLLLQGISYDASVKRNTNTAYPGQINNAVIDGLTDNVTKAEIVRKMGWGDDE